MHHIRVVIFSSKYRVREQCFGSAFNGLQKGENHPKNRRKKSEAQKKI
jgi:hypothetical protein